MSNKNSHKVYVLDAILFIVFWMIIWWGLMIWKQDMVLSKLIEKHESKYTKFSAIDEILENEYYDEELLKNSENDMIEWALVGYVKGISDPHTVYLKEEANTNLENELENKAGFAGIWAVIEKVDNYVVISEVLKNSPAAKAGLLTLDKIYMVEDHTLEDLTATEVVQLIRGEKWTEVTLFIEREWKNEEGNKRFLVTIVRDDVNIPSVTSEIFEKDGKNLLYIEISLISEKTTSLLLEEVRDAIQSVGKIDWIILDLRGNEWWYLEEAAKLLGHFFPKDTLLVKSKYKAYEDLEYTSKWRWELWNYPIVILVDQLTASASEIIALKFQEEWKTIIWMQTFGKWSIQTVEAFKDGSSLKYTVWKWYSPNDVNIDKEWITPDIEVERDYEKYKEDWTDNQLETAKEELLKIIK